MSDYIIRFEQTRRAVQEWPDTRVLMLCLEKDAPTRFETREAAEERRASDPRPEELEVISLADHEEQTIGAAERAKMLKQLKAKAKPPRSESAK